MPGKPLDRTLMLVSLALAFASVALADFRLERQLALAPGGKFVLDADSGSVEIRGVDRADARILVTSPSEDVEERFTFAFEERDDDAVVRVERRAGPTRGWFSGRSDRLRFEIEVPRSADIDLSTAGGDIDATAIGGRVEVDSSGGSLEIADVEGDVDARTSGGAVDATDVRGSARLDTSGGAIRARRVEGDLTAKTSGGSIEIEDAGGAVEAHTSGGPVSAAFAAGNGSGGSLSTSGGSITATVDPAVSLQLDAHTSGGRVRVDLPITVSGSMSRDTVRGALNGGGSLLKLRSSGGSVRVGGR
jgi:DUF4097 and DUF4098 domain-containing protein YvlB